MDNDRMLDIINSVGPGFGPGKSIEYAIKTTSDFVYRVCGMDQIEDIINCGYVRPKGYGSRRERVGDKIYWSQGNNNLYYFDKRPVLQAPCEKVQNGQPGPIPLEDLCAVWLFDENTNSYTNQLDYINELRFNQINNNKQTR